MLQNTQRKKVFFLLNSLYIKPLNVVFLNVTALYLYYSYSDCVAIGWSIQDILRHNELICTNGLLSK